jgi:zinc protease
MDIKRKSVFFQVILTVCLAAGWMKAADSLTTAIPNLDSPLPVDQQVVIGQLKNGLKYYIRQNNEPQKRVEMRLAINAGSVLEEDNQQGLAHFVEHMAFNGTRHFPKHKLINYLESIGMQFGADLNAYTGFDDTVYMLQVPTDSAVVIDTALQILADWANGLLFDSLEVEKERGVIVEEWRLGRGANARLFNRHFPVLFHRSRYAERLPIGKKEIIETAPVGRLRQFYTDWYRPDLMAVIVVGDIDVVEIEQKIKIVFEQLEGPISPRPRPIYPVPDHSETLFSIASDPEATYNSIAIYYKKPINDEQTHRAYRKNLIRTLHHRIMNERLNELLYRPDPPFLYAGVSEGQLVRSKKAITLNAVVKDGGVLKGMEALLLEARRIREFGITASELERQKQDMLRSIEEIYNERNKTASRLFAAEYLRNFLESEPIPGIEYEYRLWQSYLPGIALEEVNQVAADLLTDENRVVLISAPEKDSLDLPDADEIRQVFENVATADIKPYSENVSDESLLSGQPVAGEIVEEVYDDSLRLYQWKLRNGATVFVKPTDFKNDQVLFRAFSPGGLSLYPDSVYISAKVAADIANYSGLGKFDNITLNKKLSGIDAQVLAYINDLNEGLSGSASPRDLETLFQLVYLYFTEPRADSTAYRFLRHQIMGYLENRNASPEAAYSDTIRAVMSNYHFRTRPWQKEMLAQIDLDTAHRIFKERFGNVGDFTFIFVGNIEIDSLATMVKKYIGGLPGKLEKEQWRDEQIQPPVGVIEKIVRKGLEEKAVVTVFLTGPMEWQRRERLKLSILASILQIRLRKILREDEGGVYSVSVSALPEHYPQSRYQFVIRFGCAPEKVDTLRNLAMAEIQKMVAGNISEIDFHKVLESLRRSNEIEMRQNGAWLSKLYFYLWNAENLRQILHTPAILNTFTLESIKQAAKQYLTTPNIATFILLPEKVKPNAPK